MEKGLGRLHSPDERDARYPLKQMLARMPEEKPTKKYWYLHYNHIGDQTWTSECVGYSWNHFLKTAPLRTFNGPLPTIIYQEAQRRDEWPGEDYDGTSVRAGVEYLQELGHIASYVWTYHVDELKDYILTQGPVIMGSLWFDTMFETDASGYVTPKGGEEVGGHAYLCAGYSTIRRAFRFINSWGREWGQGGRFWLTEDDVQALLDREGEACAAVETPLVPTNE